MGKPENLFRGKMFVSFNRKKQNKNERKEKKEEEESQINRRENSSSCRFQAGRTYIVVLRRSNSSPIMFWLSSFFLFSLFFFHHKTIHRFAFFVDLFSLSLSLVGFSFNLFCYFPGRINHIWSVDEFRDAGVLPSSKRLFSSHLKKTHPTPREAGQLLITISISFIIVNMF